MVISLWPVAMVFMNFNRYLRSINMVPKYSLYQVSLSPVVCYEILNKGNLSFFLIL